MFLEIKKTNAFNNSRVLLLFLVFFLLSVLFIFYPIGDRYDFKILSLYAIASGISLFGVFLDKDNLSFSVNKTFYLFHYFFFGLAPAIQFKKNITFFGAQKLHNDIYYELGFCLIFVQLTYFLIYNKLIKEKRLYRFVKNFSNSNTNYNFHTHLILSVFSFLFFLFLISENFEVIFLKPKHHWQKNNTQLGLVGYTLLLMIRAVPLLSYLLYKLNNKVTSYFKDMLLLLFVVLVAFPTSLPRATMVSYYLPIVLLYIPFFSKKYNYVLSFLVLFFVLFPVFNFFRSYEFSDVDMGFQLFETAHLDAFHNFAQLYSQNIITNGRQLLGSILFFVQEAQWSNRPVGSGQMLAEINGYNYTNISMPFWGEGYVNFGFFGIFFFILFIALLNALLDLFYKLNKNNIGVIFFLFFLGYEFYLLRGDLYSSCKKMFSFALALIIVKLSLNFVDFLVKKMKKVN